MDCFSFLIEINGDGKGRCVSRLKEKGGKQNFDFFKLLDENVDQSRTERMFVRPEEAKNSPVSRCGCHDARSVFQVRFVVVVV